MDFRAYREVMDTELRKRTERGENRKVSAEEFTTALVGMTIYPFIARQSTLYSGQMDDEKFRQHVAGVRAMIPEMIMGWLHAR